jgi:hypothetical protein
MWGMVAKPVDRCRSGQQRTSKIYNRSRPGHFPTLLEKGLFGEFVVPTYRPAPATDTGQQPASGFHAFHIDFIEETPTLGALRCVGSGGWPEMSVYHRLMRLGQRDVATTSNR